MALRNKLHPCSLVSIFFVEDKTKYRILPDESYVVVVIYGLGL